MIFAATPNIKHYYEEFAKFIGQPNSVGELKSEAKDLGKLIETQYDSLTSKLIAIILAILSNIYILVSVCKNMHTLLIFKDRSRLSTTKIQILT